MSAFEDYPSLASWAWYFHPDSPHPMQKGTPEEARRALDEIDKLRGDVSKMLAMLAAAGAEWPA